MAARPAGLKAPQPKAAHYTPLHRWGIVLSRASRRIVRAQGGFAAHK